ncbi:MAG: glycine cleavage system aminomethyltransferase GcvT [Gammaproteobacteria bacterium]|nr:glycine cleavage system aminomethyltransferase GcvT [Gammaproteobacteria bacterium]
MSKQTTLYPLHVDAGAQIVDFGGWAMPLHYGSQVEEHHLVRKSCGLFDVSHMTIVDISGAQAESFLSVLLANDVARLKANGNAMYSCMLNDDGGVVDDLITYRRDAGHFRMVVNAATRDNDLAWMNARAQAFDVELTEQPDYAMIAVQGPTANQVFARVAEHHGLAGLWSKVKELKPFNGCEYNSVYVGRTGYTGEDGYEIMMPAAHAADTWKAFIAAGAGPCGLGCRDTLRIEAGLNLYGTDMDQSTTPLEAGLAWTVNFTDPDRDFIGRQALEQQKAAGQLPWFGGIILDGRGVIRGGQQVVRADGGAGIVTSGTFSPTMGRSIGFVRIADGDSPECTVNIRKREIAAHLCALPFVRNGTIRVE